MLTQDLKSLLTTSEHIKHYFPEESNRIIEFIDKNSSLFFDHEDEIIQSPQSQINEFSFDKLQRTTLIRLQNIFNQMEPLLDSNINRLDAVKSLIEYFGQNGFKVLIFFFY